jgi:hypothetical protein
LYCRKTKRKYILKFLEYHLFVHFFRWSAAINHVKQHRQLTGCSNSNILSSSTCAFVSSATDVGIGNIMTTLTTATTTTTTTTTLMLSEENKTQDELSIIMNFYSQRLTMERNGKLFFIKAKFNNDFPSFYLYDLENFTISVFIYFFSIVFILSSFKNYANVVSS